MAGSAMAITTALPTMDANDPLEQKVPEGSVRYRDGNGHVWVITPNDEKYSAVCLYAEEYWDGDHWITVG